MIELEKACGLYEEKFPNQVIDSILDVGDEWVFSCRDAKTLEELDSAPIAIAKGDGRMRTFFPPANMNKLKNAVKVVRDSDKQEN